MSLGSPAGCRKRTNWSPPLNVSAFRAQVRGNRAVLCRADKFFAIFLCISTAFQAAMCELKDRPTKTVKWTVGISGEAGNADQVAAELGCKNLGLVRGFNDVYLFEKPLERDLASDSSIEDDYDSDSSDYESQTYAQVHRTKRELESHPCVDWVDPQMAQTRVKRGALPSASLMLRQILKRAESLPKPSSQLLRRIQKLPGLQLLGTGAIGLSGGGGVGGGAGSGGGVVPGASLQTTSHHVSGVQSHGYKNSLDRGVYSSFTLAEDKKLFNDELWTHQWYLQDTRNVAHLQSDIELKVEDVWKMGFTGNGIVVTVLDDGLEWNHTDILPNYDARASWDMNNNRSDPFPRYDSYNTNNHGTRCAGEIAMVANNRKCGVGVAPRAKIGGIKCLDGEIQDHIESMSLLHNIDYIDIYSGSWGPSDNGQVVDGPKRLASQALERGVKFGRQGKGALYVWANGNGGALGDNCNCDGYVNSIYTISIGGVTQQGQIPFYGERCSSTLAVTCSSGAYMDRKIVTTDLHNKCTIDYSGTSAAAPLAAGVYALALEANRNLTWRDAQHLTVWTSNPIPLRDNPGWKRNAAGFIFNSRFGFGLLNAKAMVEAALKWTTMPNKSICVVRPQTRLPTFLQSRHLAHATFVTDGCQLESAQVKPAASSGARTRALATPPAQQQVRAPVVYLEHVQLVVDIEYTSRGNLDIYLISPSGTVSTLLSRRPLDVSRNGFDKWPLMSVHFWGEKAPGKWTVIVRDKDSQSQRGLLRNATLILHGTSTPPAHLLGGPRVYEGESEVGPFIDPALELDEDDIYDLNTFPNDMALVRDDTYQPGFIKSVIAMEQLSSGESGRS